MLHASLSVITLKAKSFIYVFVVEVLSQAATGLDHYPLMQATVKRGDYHEYGQFHPWLPGRRRCPALSDA